MFTSSFLLARLANDRLSEYLREARTESLLKPESRRASWLQTDPERQLSWVGQHPRKPLETR